MQSYEQLAVTREEHLSDSLADEFVRNFMQDEPIPGITYENALVQRFLPEITLAEVNALARDWMPDRNRVVAVSAPKKAGVTVPDETTLAAVIKSAGGDKLTAYVDTVSAKPLLDPLPKPGKVANTATKGGTGSAARASPSGRCRTACASCCSRRRSSRTRSCSTPSVRAARRWPTDKDFVPAETAEQVVAQGGLGTLSSLDLGKKLTGKSALVRADIDDMSEGLSGRSLRRDLETMFQLIYLTFTQPRADAEAFSVMKGQLQAVLANRQARPETAFADALNGAVSQNHLRARPMSPEVVAQMDLDEVDGVLQGSLRGRERLHVRLRRQLRSRDDEAARGAVSGQPAVAAPQGSGARRRHPSARRRRREDGDEGARAAQPGGHRLHRSVQEHAARSGWSSARSRTRSKAACSACCARISAAPTASASSPTTRSSRRRNTG